MFDAHANAFYTHGVHAAKQRAALLAAAALRGRPRRHQDPRAAGLGPGRGRRRASTPSSQVEEVTREAWEARLATEIEDGAARKAGAGAATAEQAPPDRP